MALIEFYGEECPHCIKMAEVAQKLSVETGLVFERNEIWHNKENEKKMEPLDRGRCGGVPFFINTDTDKFVCGEASYEELKNLAEGK